MGKASKGSAFEREVCVTLSQWWTDGKRDDVFWRAAQSGGRAKLRGRKGKDTHGQHGDIIAVDPFGEPLIDLVTIELKRGYSRSTPYDVMDRAEKSAQQQWEKWLEQVYESHRQAGSYAWWIITRRDYRRPMIFMPSYLAEEMMDYDDWTWHCQFAVEWRFQQGVLNQTIYGMRLDDFLETVPPITLRELAKVC